MDTEQLSNVKDFCEKCGCITKYESGEMSLGDLRRACSDCRTWRNGKGIYKADAIVTALRLHKKIKEPYRGGRKSKIPESVKQAMKEQHDKGIPIRQIAENTGYNKNTVSKILKKMNAFEKPKKND